jgi:hypothetical protein
MWKKTKQIKKYERKATLFSLHILKYLLIMSILNVVYTVYCWCQVFYLGD